MKRLKLSLLAFAFGITAAPLLLAQDAAAPIRRVSPVPSDPAPTPIGKQEEPATPTPAPTATPRAEETPAPVEQAPPTPAETPAPAEPTTPTATPTPPTAEQTPAPAQPPAAKPEEKKEKSTAAPVSPSGRRILREKPVRAVEARPRRPWIDPSDTIGGSRPTFDFSRRSDGDVADVIRGLENEWQAAIRKHDVAALSDLLAEDFVGTSSTGRVGSKSTLLSEMRKDKNDYKSVEARGMSVRTPGEDTAIVTGVTKESGTTQDGRRFKTARRFTDTWVKRNKQWRCIASQTTELSKD